MKTFRLTITLCILAFFATEFLSSCKKDSDSDPIEQEPIDSTIYQFKINATKIETKAMNPALGSNSRMCFGNNKFYVFSRSSQKFMSYDISTNTWKNLNYTDQLAYAGYNGKMIYTQSHSIFYLHDLRDIYYTSDYPDLTKRDSWNPTKSLPEEYSSGESGYALYYNDIYSIGGRARIGSVNQSSDIRKYNSITDEWSKTANLPSALEWTNALVHNDQLYIIGESSSNTKRGFIYDILSLTTKSFPIPNDFTIINYDRYQFTAYQDYLFLNNGSKEFFVYNTKTQKWNNWTVIIDGDFLSGSVNLFVAQDGKFYAAGEKDGNFALYELQITFPKKEL